MKRIEYILKHNRFFQAIYVFIFSLFFKFLGLLIRPKKYILFQSLIGKNYGESPKIIYDKIKNDPFFKDYTCIWAFENPNNFPHCDCKRIKLNSFSYFYYALKSKIWISNAGIERGLRFKHRKTIHINTDHGFPFKYIGNDQKNRNDYNFKTVNLFCCCSEYDKKIKVNGYKIKPENAKIIGYPINDSFFKISTEKVLELRRKFNIPENKKVILYAPTWRDYEQKDKNAIPINFNKWKSTLGNEYVIFVRMHHLALSEFNIAFDEVIRDGFTNISMEDITMISDILISDYSAIMFNYSILERPIVAFVYDNEEYQKNRGTYISPFDMFKGSCFVDEDSMLSFIKNMDYQEECKKTIELKNKYMFCDGNATKRCIEYLKEKLS